jgi:hypothetical protein
MAGKPSRQGKLARRTLVKGLSPIAADNSTTLIGVIRTTFTF